MVQQRIPKSSSRPPITQAKTSQPAPRQLPVQAQQHSGGLPTRQDGENDAFHQNKLETLALQRKQASGAITPVEQERLGVLQAKKQDFWAQRLAEKSRFGHHFDSVSPAPSTGLPNHLKSGIESLSGISMDGVNVHYSSPQPAQLNALAYTKASDIHVAPGQEQHLPHEAWHVVQQAQGRVKPTTQLKDGVPVNDDAGLEREADVMGVRALANAVQVNAELQKVERPQREPGPVQPREPEGQSLEDLPTAHTEAGNAGVVQRVLKVNGNPMSKAFILGHKADFLESAHMQEALQKAGVVVGDWEFVFDELVKLAEHGSEFLYTRTSEAVIAIIQAGGADALIAAKEAAGEPEAAAEAEVFAAPPPDYSKDREKKLKAKEAQAKAKQPAAAPPKPRESPYKSKVKEYDKALGGAIVLVEKNYVVVMEHYQLKHNPDIKVLYTGGSFGGKKGSTLGGGWAAHEKTYAPAILAHVKPLIPGGIDPKTNSLTLKKVRLADIDAYIAITEKDGDWIIAYHGNPPE